MKLWRLISTPKRPFSPCRTLIIVFLEPFFIENFITLLKSSKAMVDMQTIVAESPTVRLLQGIHNRNIDEVKEAILAGAKIVDSNFNALEYALYKAVFEISENLDLPGVGICPNSMIDGIEVCQYLIEEHPTLLTDEQVKCIFNLGDARLESSLFSAMERNNLENLNS